MLLLGTVWPIQNIAKFGRNLVASEIRYYLEFQEYPNSLETGFASVYNWPIQNIAKFGRNLVASEIRYYLEFQEYPNSLEIEAFSMKNIQYLYGGNGTIRTIKNCEFFPDIKVSSIHINCTTCLFLRKMEENHTFFDEEREKLIEEWPIQNIAKFDKNLVASEIRYYLEFQEYPNSLETGFASVYNVSGWDETDAKETFSMKNIQYSYRGNGTIRTIKNCKFFPGIKVSKEQRECLGVKVYEFTSKELDVGHTLVDFSIPLFKKMFEADVEFHKQATICLYAKAHEYQCGHINNDIKCTGKPKLGEFTQRDESNVIDECFMVHPNSTRSDTCRNSISSKRKFIRCINWKMRELDHRYMIIPDNVDLELLETMFNEYSYHRDESNVIDECFMVHPNSTRSDTCLFLHKTRNHIVKGIINKKAEPCPVKFYHIIPEDLKNCPFIITISVGSIIKAYLNEKQISDLHPLLNNQSKINYYIEKTRCSQYPFGQNILEVIYEFMKHEMSFLDNGQYIILCATKQQLKTIKELTYIEIDMAFKRIHGKTNEWEVSAYLSHVQKTLTFVRIFTNIETAETYKNLFEDLFTCIEKDIGEIFNFYHIHGKGLGCILADQHKGQALDKL
ncbi:hypothetical protein Glove_279g56 [Diversispora epigaea]|uniref:Uncharacterized protein n=2 Tax=Diversispora epigaea TaxID=1348612 RepID=A0A397IA75_9GLOM|nr:hypothetical protein Glove_279g56 [Diversispora epigaea]